ncbi:hypothetical protein [Mammaliicoccus sciuri]|uniref:hypothetical protein n=1 Tax=Mammaliicoccus sciuri TaxID=1296 RepID=UPI003F57AD6C
MEIKYVTTHYIDVDKKYPKYSKDIVDFSLDIDGEETFKRYFKEHIEKQRVHNATKPSKFVHIEEDNNDFVKSLNELNKHISSTENILKITKNLTLKLHKTMKNKSKSSGILIFVIYVKSEQYNLCIMKMEPENGVRFNPDEVQLEEINNLLPNSNTRLHKAAFFELNKVDDNYKFFVIDKQVKDDNVSGFFINNFLEGEIIIDDKRANRFIANSESKLLEIIREEKDDITTECLSDIKEKFHGLFFTNRNINFADEVQNILNDSIDDEEITKTVKNRWSDSLIEKHGTELYFEFTPINVPKFRRTWKDKDERIILKYDPHISDGVDVNLEDENFIIIKINKIYIDEISEDE